jgi:type II secretory ATPase GspE/PulE/Tfp pilus assembly ATPase PilB-like protein
MARGSSETELARGTPGAFFCWEPAGVGRRRLPCPRCGAGTPVALLENLFEALCGACGRNLALERARTVQSEAGVDALLETLVGLGVMVSEADGLLEDVHSETDLVHRLVETGSLRCDLRLTLDLDLATRSHEYGAAPLRALVLATEVERALEVRRERGGVLLEILRGMVLSRLAATVRSVGAEVGLEVMQSADERDSACVDALPRRALEVYRAVPLRREGEALVVALWDPLDFEGISDLESLSGSAVHAVGGTAEALREALADLGVSNPSNLDAGISDEGSVSPGDLEVGDDLAEAPFFSIVLEALEEGAEQVLIEPGPEHASLRFRVRGELRKERLVPSDVGALVAEHLEGLVAADSPAHGIQREPRRDGIRIGHARCELAGLPVTLDFRVVETPLGPALALELDEPADTTPRSLGELGLSLDALAAYEAALTRGRGLVIVTGPRRGGKTQAYYASLERAVRLGGAVVSLEQRVVRFLPGATQLELTSDLRGLGSLLRPAPDWLGVDGALGASDPGQSASVAGALELAVDATLAGTGVILTVPAPDARSALWRLEMAGVPTRFLETQVTAVLGRRVLARNCPHCSMQRTPDPNPNRRLGFDPKILDRLTPWIGLGCAACADGGTAGQLTLAELLLPGPDGRLAPAPGAPLLSERAEGLVRDGVVTLESVADLFSRGI